MFVMTAKLSKPKLLAAGVVVLGMVVGLVMLLCGKGGTAPSLPLGDSSEARAAYLATYGWSIDVNAKETQTVTIPDGGENKVFARYNELQQSQGFDLSPYAGKEVTRYVYEILNYPEASAPVYAGVLVHEGRIIGGEITDTSPGGVIHGFKKPGSSTQSAPTEPSPTETSASVSESEETLPPSEEATEPTTHSDP